MLPSNNKVCSNNSYNSRESSVDSQCNEEVSDCLEVDVDGDHFMSFVLVVIFFVVTV